MSSTETLNQKLAKLGYATEPSGFYRKRIMRDGHEVFEGTAHEVSEWLARASSPHLVAPATSHALTGWAVWEHTPTGQILRTFADEYLAMQFAVSVGSVSKPYDINH